MNFQDIKDTHPKNQKNLFNPGSSVYFFIFAAACHYFNYKMGRFNLHHLHLHHRHHMATR